MPKGITHDSSHQQKDVMQNYYRLHAKIYDATRWSFLFGRTAIIRQLPLDKQQPVHILEVGCGTGYNTALLAKHYPNAQITALDVSEEMIAKARQKTKAYQERVKLVAEPYGQYCEAVDAPLDAVLFSYSLSMINPQWEEVILKAKSDLKPNGCVAIVDFHRSKFPWFEAHMGNNHVRMDSHLLPFLNKHFRSSTSTTHKAYGGIWEYMMFIGKRTS
ncbi:MAG: methyltransferase domain-containing protein [Bacteroidota bacterium]